MFEIVAPYAQIVRPIWFTVVVLAVTNSIIHQISVRHAHLPLVLGSSVLDGRFSVYGFPLLRIIHLIP